MNCLLSVAWCVLTGTLHPLPLNTFDELGSNLVFASFATSQLPTPERLSAAETPTPRPESSQPAAPLAVREFEAELIPYLGMYLPFGNVVAVSRGAPYELRKKHVGAALVGARLALRVDRHIAVETTLGYSRSMVARTDADSTVDIDAGVLLATARAVYCLNECGIMGGWGVHLAAGLGTINRHGPAWSGFEGTTSLAGVFAAGGRLRLGNTATARLEIEDYVTRPEIWHNGDGVLSRGRLRHDTVWSLGVSFGVGRAH